MELGRQRPDDPGGGRCNAMSWSGCAGGRTWAGTTTLCRCSRPSGARASLSAWSCRRSMRSAPWARSSRPSAGNSRSRLRWWTSWWWPTADPPTAPPPWPSRLARGSSTSSRCCPRGTVPGKGEALWKSLYDTDGDLVVFIDSDLVAFDPQFVVGLLGPLLTDPDVGYVKALYDRPLTTTDGMIPTGGGRVTELVARPLLNALWPTLAGFVQPLSGEYAGRRELLERVPFVSGYGVELGLLVDLVELADIDALAQ